jgi:hypothetical protein
MHYQTHHGALGSHGSQWTYRNNRYHENSSQRSARYKIEALGRRYEEIWENHAGLVERLHAFQTNILRRDISSVTYFMRVNVA